jgi:hypothetical protein
MIDDLVITDFIRKNAEFAHLIAEVVYQRRGYIDPEVFERALAIYWERKVEQN